MELRQSAANEVVTRPSNCPFCQGRAVDTLAKVITAATTWRCRTCEQTWTIASRKTAAAPRW
jgi:ribosomal protein L37AE/L43A